MFKRLLALLTLLAVLTVLGTGCVQKAIGDEITDLRQWFDDEEEGWINAYEFGETRLVFENEEGTRLWCKARLPNQGSEFVVTYVRYTTYKKTEDGSVEIATSTEMDETYSDLEFGVTVSSSLADENGHTYPRSNILVGHEFSYHSSYGAFEKLKQKGFRIVRVRGCMTIEITESTFPEVGKKFLLVTIERAQTGIWGLKFYLALDPDLNNYHQRFPLHMKRAYNMIRIRPKENMITLSARGANPLTTIPIKIEGGIIATLQSETGEQVVIIDDFSLKKRRFLGTLKKNGNEETIKCVVFGPYFHLDKGIWYFGFWGPIAKEEELLDLSGLLSITDKSGAIYEVRPAFSDGQWLFLVNLKGGSKIFRIVANRLWLVYKTNSPRDVYIRFDFEEGGNIEYNLEQTTDTPVAH